jgi:putative copper export protein
MIAPLTRKGHPNSEIDMQFVRWIHLIASATWVGGLITLGALVPALRRQNVDRSVLQAVARQFGRVSWTAMGVAVLSGAWMAIDFLQAPALAVKVGTVVLTAGLAAWHQFAARDQSPRMRGILQGLILLGSLGIVAAAVAL